MNLLPLLPGVFGVSDYVVGRDFLAKAKLPGRSIWYVAPALMLLFTVGGFIALHDWLEAFLIGGLIPFTWALWRSVLGWSSFGGALNPQTPEQDARLLARNLVSSIPIALMMLFGMDVDPLLTAGSICLFSGFCVLANVWLAAEARQGHDVDPQVDFIHGALFGFMMWGILAVRNAN